MATTTQTTKSNTSVTVSNGSTAPSPMLAANAASVLLQFTAETSFDEVKALLKNNEMSIGVLKNNQEVITLTKESAMAAAAETKEATIIEAKAQETAGVISIASSAGQALTMAGSIGMSYKGTTLETTKTEEINSATEELNAMKAERTSAPQDAQAGMIREDTQPDEERNAQMADKEQQIENLRTERELNRQTYRQRGETMMYFSQTVKGACDGYSSLQSGQASETAAGIKEIAASDTAMSGYYNAQASAMTSQWNALNSAAAAQRDAAASILAATGG